MSSYRQGQGPFGGAVPPPGDSLVFQEEFTRGKGEPFHPLLGPGTQELPEGWLPWIPLAAVADPFTYVEILQQRAAVLVAAPAGDPGYQWAGSVYRLPPPEALPFIVEVPETGEGFCFLSLFHGCGAGPAFWTPQLELGPAELINGVLVSATDLSVTPEAEFVALGLEQVVPVSGPDDWAAYAIFSHWLDSSTLLSFARKPIQQTGALYRLDMVIERDRASAEDPFLYETDLLASFSTNGGLDWTLLGEDVLKGPDGIPRVVGLGATGRRDTLQNVTNRAAIGAEYIRIYAQPLTEQALLLSPDGGRNWP